MPKATKVSEIVSEVSAPVAPLAVDPVQASAAAPIPPDPAPVAPPVLPTAPVDPETDPSCWWILSEIPAAQFGSFVDRLLAAQKESRNNLRYVSVVADMTRQLEELATVPGSLRRDYQTSRRIDATKSQPAKRTTYNPASLYDALTGKTPLTASQLFRSKRAD